LSKIIERVAASRFKSQISTHNLLPASNRHSTETAVLSVDNDLIRASDNGQVSSLVLLDLSAAFDIVDHEIAYLYQFCRSASLWVTLCLIGARRTLRCHSYLIDRTQSFSYADRTSFSFTIDCSVSQGSVLGPLEFEAYTEDIVDDWTSWRSMT